MEARRRERHRKEEERKCGTMLWLQRHAEGKGERNRRKKKKREISTWNGKEGTTETPLKRNLEEKLRLYGKAQYIRKERYKR